MKKLLAKAASVALVAMLAEAPPLLAADGFAEKVIKETSAKGQKTRALNLKKAWTKNLITFMPDWLASPLSDVQGPLVDEGVIYVGSSKGRIHAFDAEKGAIVWTFDADSDAHITPAAYGNRLYFGSTHGTFYCLDKKTGKEKWRFSARSEISSSSAFSEETVYVQSADNRLYALDAATGEKRWVYAHAAISAVGARFANRPAVSMVSGSPRVFAVFSDGTLASLDASTGKEFWKTFTVGIKAGGTREAFAVHVLKAPAVSAGIVYVLGDNARVIGYDAETGLRKEYYEPADAVDFSVSDGFVYIAGKTSLTAVDRATGVVAWRGEFSRGEAAGIINAGDVVFALLSYRDAPLGVKQLEKDYGRVEAFDSGGKGLVWETKLSAKATGGAAAGGVLVVATDNGDITVFSEK